MGSLSAVTDHWRFFLGRQLNLLFIKAVVSLYTEVTPINPTIPWQKWCGMSFLTHLKNPSSHCHLLVLSWPSSWRLRKTSLEGQHLWRNVLPLVLPQSVPSVQWQRTPYPPIQCSCIRPLTLGWFLGGISTLKCNIYSSDLAAFYLAAYFHHLELFFPATCAGSLIITLFSPYIIITAYLELPPRTTQAAENTRYSQADTRCWVTGTFSPAYLTL